MVSVDIDKLVTSVFTRPAIWDVGHEAHHNRFILDKLWQEVAQETGSSKVNVKSKWKYLRDNFRKELAKQPKTQSGLSADVSNIRSSWPYFSSLLFLKDQFGPKKSPSSNNESTQEYNSVDEDVSDLLEVSYDEPEVPQVSSFPSPSASYFGESSNDEPSVPATANAFKRRKTAAAPELVEDFLPPLELKPKPKLLKEVKQPQRPVEEDTNEDFKFFESLLPHVKKIPPHQKLLMRGKMLEIVQQFAYEMPIAIFHLPRSNESPQTTAIPE